VTDDFEVVVVVIGASVIDIEFSVVVGGTVFVIVVGASLVDI
jgi:hypothetical protein